MTGLVCIVLNERESSKAALAAELSRRLDTLGLTSERVEITPDLSSMLAQKHPRVVVLDYLLGDFTTGLDVLSHFHTLPDNERPEVVFWTDEPSIQVAVQAMKLASKNYILMDSPSGMDMVVSEVNNALREQRISAFLPPLGQSLAKLDDLVFESQESIALIRRIKANIQKGSSLFLIWGPQGTGKTTLAKAIIGQSIDQHELPVVEIDLAQSLESVEAILKTEGHIAKGLAGPSSSLLIADCHCDDGKLLNSFTKTWPKLWTSSGIRACLCFEDQEFLKSWINFYPLAEVIHLRPLAERKDELAAFAKYFFALAATNIKESKLPQLDKTAIHLLENCNWPGNLDQMRAVVVDGVITATIENLPLEQTFKERLALWEDEHNLPLQEISPFTVALTLERLAHQPRAAAASLGITLKDLQALLFSRDSGAKVLDEKEY